MTEQVQLAIVTLIVLVINTWRSEVAARRAARANTSAVAANDSAVAANKAAVQAVAVATDARAEQAVASAQIHDAVNGGWKANQQVIRDLEAKVSKLEGIIAGRVSPLGVRLEEIRGQTS